MTLPKKQSTALEKVSVETSVIQIKEQSSRANTIVQLWESKELTFACMIREHGLPVMKEALLDEVSSMCELLGAEMNETQLTYLLDFVAEKYKYFTISDLTIITRKMVAEKVYHKPSMQSFICAFEAHDLERDEHASIEQQKKQFKDEKETDEGIKAWRKNYSALYVKAQKKKRPEKQIRKEKDVEARQLNKERIEEMKKLYPDDMITTPEEVNKMDSDFMEKIK